MRFSGGDLERVGQVMRDLVDPLSARSPDEWRSSVNRSLRTLLGADSAGFLLPGVSPVAVYSEEHDPSSLRLYPELAPPSLPCGKPVFQRAIELGASTLEEVYDGHLDRYLKSEYYQEYSGANRAHDTLSALISVEGVQPLGVAGLQFWHQDPKGRQFGARETALLRLLLPALKLGVQAQLRWGQHRTDLLTLVDQLGHAALVCDTRGKELHRSPALQKLLGEEPEHAALVEGMLEMVRGLARISGDRFLQGGASGTGGGPTIRTERATYRVAGSLYRSPLSHSPALIFVSLERLSPVLRSAADLTEAYRLTRGEIRVLHHLVAGASTAEIARHLCLSLHTVRRHTERIFAKTGAHSRAELSLRALR
jgi:DNA-binding CsgD family transcriptional regulator